MGIISHPKALDIALADFKIHFLKGDGALKQIKPMNIFSLEIMLILPSFVLRKLRYMAILLKVYVNAICISFLGQVPQSPIKLFSCYSLYSDSVHLFCVWR